MTTEPHDDEHPIAAASEPVAPTPPAEPATARRGGPPPRGARLLASLALLLALGALGGAGYLYYELIHRAPADDTRQRVAAAEQTAAAARQRAEQLAAEQRRAIEELRASQQRSERTLNESLREAMDEMARQAPPSTRDWQLAEVRYLLRIANHRLLMERDVQGALSLLRSADAMLRELDDFALHTVRARLADEILALGNLEGVDVQGVFLRLEAVKRELDELPLRMPEYLADEAPEAGADDGFLAVLGAQLQRFLEVRRFDGSVKPLLAPDEAVYLELNLRLMLERAQLAALRRDQLIYDESIATAEEWVNAYLDLDRNTVQRVLAELDALHGVALEQPLPDISGALNALETLLRREPS